MNDKKASSGIDADLVRELAKVLAEQGLTEIEVEHGELRLRLARMTTVAAAPAPMAYAPAPVAAPATPVADAIPVAKDHRSDARAVTSPMVGTAYLSPEPGANVFIKVGDTVTEGQTLLIVEAMKTFNPIIAPRGGKIVEIIIGDAQPVEFGQPLLLLE
ncbi:MAG: acetyl-CoA carboxylase biotin carboxyl carrier protein [Hyphomonadaceae bacterium]|nr:MAG: acetyl-CoA carboxylase biotin carboxyl carrier protein [Caulobacteraceae bacterium]MBT9447815.1 acetyl-CoA carboxylase biotin carboxyl carrier protein [Hyphomonadaceae bacterium]TPW03766.1 MAG: acetyl-CoA carboxylase biotin carboxyl carrier protein [Alphaproteobacteria bacterium]